MHFFLFALLFSFVFSILSITWHILIGQIGFRSLLIGQNGWSRDASPFGLSCSSEYNLCNLKIIEWACGIGRSGDQICVCHELFYSSTHRDPLEDSGNRLTSHAEGF